MGLLKSIDQFGKQFQFNIEGGTFKTNFGGFLTILFALGICALSWYFGFDLYAKENPFFLQKSTHFDLAPYIIDFNYSQMAVAFGLSNKNLMGNSSDLKYIEHKVFHEIRKLNETSGEHYLDKISIPLERCTNDLINLTALDILEFPQAYCFNPRNKIHRDFGGPDALGRHHYLIFQIKFCNSDTEETYNIKCASELERYNVLSSHKSYMSIVYQDNIINPSSYEVPFENKFFIKKSGLNIFNSEAAYYNQFSYRTVSLVTDAGIIFSDYEERNFIEFHEMVIDLEPPSGDFFAKINLHIATERRIYERSYLKLPDVIANVGGFIGLVQVIVEFLFSFYLDNEFNIYIYNKLYSLEIDNDNISEQKQNLSHFIELNKKDCIDNDFAQIEKDVKYMNNNNSKLQSNNLDASGNNLQQSSDKLKKFNTYQNILVKKNEKNMILNKEINKLIEFKSKKRRVIEIGLCERILFNYCCCKGDTIETKIRFALWAAVEKDLEQKSEIFETWKALDQHKLLMKLLLNENQSFMIQNAGKQLITNDSNWSLEQDKIKKLIEDNFELQKTKLSNYLEEKRQNNTLSDIDNFLFKNLDSELQDNINLERKKYDLS